MKLKPSDVASTLFRRSLQLGVLCMIVLGAAGGIWRNYKVAHNSSRLVRLMEGDFWADAYLAAEWFFGAFGESYRASFDFLGMPWSATVAGAVTADPILVLANVFATGRLEPALVPAVAVAVGIAALLGKVFCSHLCPMRLTFELGQAIRGGLLRLRIPLPHMHVETRFGGWILLGGLLASISLGSSVWFLLLPYLSLSASVFLAVSAGAVGALIALPAGWLLVDVVFAPGFFCHNVCPQGFLLEQLGRLSFLKLRKAAGPCPQNCRVCSMTCPYGLSPRDGTHIPACDNCGSCVRTCPERKLGRRFRLPVLAAALLAFVLPATAVAHHNKGLPHYGYYENYPQVPTQENIVVDGRWEMGATFFNFQGLDRSNADTPNDVKIFIYVYDLEKDTNYVGPVDFQIMLDGEEVGRFTRESIDEELIYSTRETLPTTGAYQLVANLRDVEQPAAVSLDFHIDLSEGGVSWWLIGGLVGPLIPLFLLAALGRTRRGRSRRMKVQGAATAGGVQS